MTIKADTFFNDKANLLERLDEAFLFGSALIEDHPNDIDLMLVYNNIPHDDLVDICEKIKKVIFAQFKVPAHLLVLSKREKDETQILEQINSVRIK